MPPMKRLELHQLLMDLIGSSNVYFQPPESVKLIYPCIVYHYDNNIISHADNIPYVVFHEYIVTYITRDPDDPVVELMTNTAIARFDRYYVADNLHHYSFIFTMD